MDRPRDRFNRWGDHHVLCGSPFLFLLAALGLFSAAFDLATGNWGGCRCQHLHRDRAATAYACQRQGSAAGIRNDCLKGGLPRPALSRGPSPPPFGHPGLRRAGIGRPRRRGHVRSHVSSTGSSRCSSWLAGIGCWAGGGTAAPSASSCTGPTAGRSRQRRAFVLSLLLIRVQRGRVASRARPLLHPLLKPAGCSHTR